MFNKMTVGKQIALGFGVILVMLVIIGVTSFTGINGIVKNAISMIAGEEIIGEMKVREIDHLNWLATLSDFLNNPDVKTLDIEVDHKKCKLGQWMYGEGRKKAEHIVPAVAPFLKDMEEPHRLVHSSAIDIKKNMNKLDIGESLASFYSAEIAHYKWVNTVIMEIINKKPVLSVQLDYKICGLGKWMYEGRGGALIAEYPAFGPLIRKMEEPHKIIHDTGHMINQKLKSGDYDAALALVHDKVEPNFEIVKEVLEQCCTLVRKMETDQKKAHNIFVTVTEENLVKVQSLMHRVSETVDNNMVTQQALLGGANKLKIVVAIVGIFALFLGVGIAFFIAKGLVNTLTIIAHKMSNGAEQVASASGQVSSASQSLAEGSSEQAAGIEETSSSLEEMSSMTKQNSGNADQADNLMKETNHVVSSANQSMAELIKSMEEISTASDETQKVVKTIDEIAFQTNLLALNAAVEAARAGEAGAGFAVVAEEVRNLALRSAEAAKSTAGLIEGTIKKVEEGSGLVNKTNDGFGTVAEKAAKVGELVGEISAASKEQAQGINQVNVAVTEMDKVTQQNAANAEESASASEELSAQAEQMKAMVNELVSIVGGSADKNSGSGIDTKTHLTKTSDRSGSLMFASPMGKTKKNKAVVRKTKVINPDELIPFDDAEFDDF